MNESYWDKMLNKRIGRRRALAATGATAAGAAFLAACGGDDGGGGSGDTGGAQPDKNLDPTTGKVGGKLVWQSYGDPGAGLELIKIRNQGVMQMASLTHDGLLDFAYGMPKYPGIGTEVLPALAQGLPEISPDKLTVTFKMRPASFQNGRALTSEDAKWTFDTYAFAQESAWKPDYAFIDKTEAPDPSTFVVRLKYPYADVLQSMAFKSTGAVLAREHHESGASERTLMGSGPYTFVEYQSPTITRYKRNVNYHTKPFPYFEEVDRLGTVDSEKKVADIIAKAVHLTYWFPAEERDRVKAGRPDLYAFQYPRAGSPQVYIRNDVAPFSDKRVRQALSMAYDRKQNIAAVNAGEGEADQVLSFTSAFGFRKPADLPAAKYFEFNVAEAKKLLQAAGVSLPLKVDVPTWNPTVIGQKHVDEITLITTQWRNNGIVDVRPVRPSQHRQLRRHALGTERHFYLAGLRLPAEEQVLVATRRCEGADAQPRFRQQLAAQRAD
jgi:peptide/nickel transport system substrate-binding protein